MFHAKVITPARGGKKEGKGKGEKMKRRKEKGTTKAAFRLIRADMARLRWKKEGREKKRGRRGNRDEEGGHVHVVGPPARGPGSKKPKKKRKRRKNLTTQLLHHEGSEEGGREKKREEEEEPHREKERRSEHRDPCLLGADGHGPIRAKQEGKKGERRP